MSVVYVLEAWVYGEYSGIEAVFETLEDASKAGKRLGDTRDDDTRYYTTASDFVVKGHKCQ